MARSLITFKVVVEAVVNPINSAIWLVDRGEDREIDRLP